MDEPREIGIYGYANNTNEKPRSPLVHLMTTRYGEVQSIGFHPDDAPRIAKAILAVGLAAKRGHNRGKILPLKPSSAV